MLDGPGSQLQRTAWENSESQLAFCDEKASAGGFRRAPQRLI